MHQRWRRAFASVLSGLLVMVGVVATGAVPASAHDGGTSDVIGGTPVPSWPSYFAVVIDDEALLMCGGSIIALDWILTAAHCVDPANLSRTRIRLRSASSPPVPATSILVHPNYNGDLTEGHDLALVRFAAANTGGITPIQVGAPWDSAAYAAGNAATIMGVGGINGDADGLGILRAVGTVLRSDDYMEDYYNPWYWLDDWLGDLMIGAGDESHTSCYGDSGSPLVSWRGGHPIQVGVTSFGHRGCDAPTAYMELSGPQLAWVAKKVPAIQPAWGPCIQSNGIRGQAHVHYSGVYHPTGLRDGPFYWKIDCLGIPAERPTPTPTPTDEPLPPCLAARDCP
jgi:trypsin